VIDEVYAIVEYQANDKRLKLVKEIVNNEFTEIETDRKRIK
jgi:hypothetical protein